MKPSELDLKTIPGYSLWLEIQIRQLSAQARADASLICVPCGELLGHYILEYKGQIFQLSSEETFSLLQFFVAEETIL